MNRKSLWGIIGLSLIIGLFVVNQATATITTNTPVSVTGAWLITPIIQTKLDIIFSKLEAKRINFASSELWNLYIERILGQVDQLRLKYAGNMWNLAILNSLTQWIQSLKETSTNTKDTSFCEDILPPLPFCAQPPMPICPEWMACIQMMPQPKTYTSYTTWKADRARYLYDGICSTGIVQDICTQEAKLCPDGSSVGRTGPNCAFAACPTL